MTHELTLTQSEALDLTVEPESETESTDDDEDESPADDSGICGAELDRGGICERDPEECRWHNNE